MLTGVGTLLSSGAVVHAGELILSAIAATAKTVSHLLDLPVDYNSLESSIRLVKTSGFENSDAMPASAALGISIGRPRLLDPRSSRNTSSSSTPGAHDAETSAPLVSSNFLHESTAKGGFSTVVPKAMLVFLVLDLLSIVLARQSSLNPCVSKLGIIQWVIGGILLGFPTTWLVDSVKHEYSFRAAFVTELAFVIASFLWLCYGGATVFNAVSACVDSIAPLWWLSYATSVLSLSVAGTVIFCMIVTTVLSLIYGSTQSK
jgi:hypothetical protein